MKKLLSIFFVIFPLLGFCQNYVFCPEIKTEQKQGFEGLTMSIIFKDSRVYDKKVKEKCTKNGVFSEFTSCISRTFPNININILDENKFDENPTEGTITFKIDLLKYDATFYPGVYIANTKYEVSVYSGDVDPHSGMIVTPPYSEGQPEGQPCFDLSKHDKQSYLFFLIDSPFSCIL